MKQFNLELPINSLSLGQMSFGILNELFERGEEPNIFPIGGTVDLKSFIVKEGLEEWLVRCIKKAEGSFRKDQTTVSLWHIRGSHKHITNHSILWTFHETTELTPTEVNILKNYDHVYVASNYSKSVFDQYLNNTAVCPAYFDDLHFYRTDQTYKNTEDIISFCLIGKLEKRKHTLDTLVAWGNKYGNKKEYRLNACIFNPFLNIDNQSQMVSSVFKGRVPWNINFLPFQERNTDLNDLMNVCDIHISCSGAEGWGLPVFNALCLGKQGVLMNAHSHKDFANDSNSFLFEPSEMRDIYDNIFFHKGETFNQGKFYDFRESDFHAALDKAVEVAKARNIEGEKLKSQFTVKNTVDILLSNVR